MDIVIALFVMVCLLWSIIFLKTNSVNQLDKSSFLVKPSCESSAISTFIPTWHKSLAPVQSNKCCMTTQVWKALLHISVAAVNGWWIIWSLNCVEWILCITSCTKAQETANTPGTTLLGMLEQGSAEEKINNCDAPGSSTDLTEFRYSSRFWTTSMKTENHFEHVYWFCL